MTNYNQRHAISLLEMIAAVTIMGIIASIMVPRFGNQSSTAKAKACELNRANIEVQAQLWYRNKGTWPTSDLSDISPNTTYFPSGMPTCPVDNSNYQFDSTTQKIIGHSH